ncbi:hypothetical protein KXT63_19750 [Salmonella enterica subsp. enterica serovar Weltevreden]|nr:hypothetical protein [Salmonella enterica subsp. enterica serovar Weltevreden]
MAISTPMLVTFCVYIFGMILIGFIAWRSTKNFDDYILGGRSLGPFVTALSAGASDMSGWLLMGLPGAIFLSGISESWIAIGLTLGAWINWKLVAGRLRVHTEFNNNALTLPDYFTGRFEDKSRVLRIISALAGAVNQNSERVFIELAQILFNPWIAGILLSAILAAVMSTLSCQLLVCSSAITEDLYKAFLRKSASQQELVWVGRVMVLVVALIAIALAANPDNRVLGLVSYAWAGFGAAFGPVVLFSVMWSRMTRNGALAGMIIGAVTVIVWKQYGWLDLYEIIPGFIFGSLGIVIFSLLGKAPTAAMQERFAKADAHYHSAPPSKLQAE